MGFASAPPDLDQRRREISATLDPRQRSALGQFLTPTSTAGFMASLLEFHLNKPAHLLDPGAGIGALSAAAAERWRSAKRRKGSLALTCYELEPSFWDPLEATLGTMPGVQYEIRKTEFIAAAVKVASRGEHPYTHAILNPPYKKVQTASRHRTLVRKLGLETSNLYACFVACAVAASQAGAQVVAIIPRSWMNGLYFKPFRYWLFGRAALRHVHIFERRDSAFADDGVLQENVIIKLVVGGSQGEVEVSSSADDTFGCSSVIQAVAAMAARAVAMPLTKRAANSQATELANTNSKAPMAPSPIAGNMTALRPTWSGNLPSSSSATRLPSTYTA